MSPQQNGATNCHKAVSSDLQNIPTKEPQAMTQERGCNFPCNHAIFGLIWDEYRQNVITSHHRKREGIL